MRRLAIGLTAAVLAVSLSLNIYTLNRLTRIEQAVASTESDLAYVNDRLQELVTGDDVAALLRTGAIGDPRIEDLAEAIAQLEVQVAYLRYLR